MARREIGEINAGSMADIAFLLLIFFLVTTTMDTDIAIERILPQKNDEDVIPPIVKEKNVLVVRCNMQDQLLVESKLTDIGELRDITIEFFTNPDKRGDLPEKTLVTAALCDDRIAFWKNQLASDPGNFEYENEISKWEGKLEAVNLLGEYMELPDAAIVSLQNDNWTSYDMYIQVQNELAGALNDLRNNLCRQKFGRDYTDLNPIHEEDKAIIRAIRMVYPQRISEAEPKNLGGN